jgi:hypothetical protein
MVSPERVRSVWRPERTYNPDEGEAMAVDNRVTSAQTWQGRGVFLKAPHVRPCHAR